ncbi:thiamine pyrophosphokinase [Anaerobranca californiensis DSM 14826]|jgi:thiamine pyrophosphokinase|uniref:Thiamine diphosphokinase n=1 Tax=Anaerobranca californiensis DSM 14826 TaxID=1120989 RepID=A0A1M6KQ10_9FIRM|nr:thiamine diphosphokinase [Anaerobranca californiensis]SHJ60986.1 thiamine pyrophosphokinase [Anaerobranca californiensis DSM 14826]
MAILVFLNGSSVKDSEFFKGNIDLIIGVDGGFNNIPPILLKNNRIEILGDLDSIKNLPNKYKILQYPKDKDLSDFELALKYLQNNYKDQKVIIYGLTGGRIDHQLFNFFVLNNYIKDNYYIGETENEIIYFCHNSFILKGYKGYTFSIFPLEELKKLTIKGAYYSLDREDVGLYQSLTLSNIIISETLNITVKTGNFAVIINKKIENEWKRK